jgi:hypothetical protein
MIKAPDIYQIKITLEQVSPAIWRQILVPADLFLHDFHKVIQTAMGWENAHLHQFTKNGRTFGIADDESDLSDKFMDYTSIRLMDILKKESDTMKYIYDFGDYWTHEILLEKILEPNSDLFYPMCKNGERSCPPEDCGGPPGYIETLKILKQAGHPDRDDLLEWLGEDWDSEDFNIDIVNEMLLEDDFGCLPLID